jgi:hypothetical protein
LRANIRVAVNTPKRTGNGILLVQQRTAFMDVDIANPAAVSDNGGNQI